MEKKPIYVTFEQAQKLKEFGFSFFNEKTKSAALNNRYEENQHYSFYRDARNWDISGYETLKPQCVLTFEENVGTNSSRINTLLASYGIFDGNNGGIVSYLAPEQWQVIDWLRIEHGIWVQATFNTNMESYKIDIINVFDNAYVCTIDGRTENKKEYGWNSPQKAYSAAFDYVLSNLIKNTKKD